MRTQRNILTLLVLLSTAALVTACSSSSRDVAADRPDSDLNSRADSGRDATVPESDATSAVATDTPADNTGINERDRSGTQPTAQDQSESPADRETSQKIRAAIVGDSALSMSAKNVKVITVNGVVTLRGPVNNAAERTAIAQKAEQIAGAGKVVNNLEVANPS